MDKSSNKIVACSPNISEGRDIKKLRKMLANVEKNRKLKLLSVHSYKEYNRTKVLFMGPPEEVKRAAVEIVTVANKIIDMTKHKGKHPRTGAVDVIPFIPMKNIEMSECIKISHEVGEKIASKLNIPVFFYSEAAKRDEYKELSHIRDNEYSGLKKKFEDGTIKPDVGPDKFNSKSGVVVVGARPHSINMKFFINTTNFDIADKVAKQIRESGTELQDGTHVAGKLKSVLASACKDAESKKVFISVGLTDLSVTPLHIAYIDTKKALENLHYDIEAAEIQGHILKNDLLEAGKYFMKIRNKNLSNEKEILRYVLGEMKVLDFNIKKKMLEL
jgi:glutamate formiminotransferase/formiminotetrahydrofolate cyclodeaminase